MDDKRQKIQLELALASELTGEAPKLERRGTEASMAEPVPESPAGEEQLMEQVCERRNMQRALAQVKRNKGSAGVDGLSVQALSGYLKEHWLEIREQLLVGQYGPQPVRRVEIPKPGGSGRRKLGIPCVVDRLVQQALLQVLQPIFEPSFAEASYGFRPGRSAHQAVRRAQDHIAAGHRWVVDIDLAQFFDRVNHDLLMGRVAKQVRDKRVLKLIRAFLTAGVMAQGLVSATREGTPQGGPLSPLLSNILLTDLDRELERRGHAFVRYADDCNIYVKSERAGQRVKASITGFLHTRLKLQVNEAKSAVAVPWQRKFLGFSFSSNRAPLRRIAPAALLRFKQRVRELTARHQGRSLRQVIARVAPYVQGWRGYFGFSEIPSVLHRLDQWLRRRLRSLVWQQWQTGRRRFAALVGRGVSRELAAKTAGSARGPWRLAGSPALNIALPNALFVALGLPTLDGSTSA